MTKIKILQLWNEVLKNNTSAISSPSEKISNLITKETSTILKEIDYSYLLEKPIENFSLEELKYIEKLFTKNDYVLTEKRKKLIENLKDKFWEDFMIQIYNRIIKIKLSDINNNNKIRTILMDENNNSLCWRYKTCNWFWIPFWLEWNNYKILTKINNDEIHLLHQLDADYDDDWIYLFWQYLNQKWEWDLNQKLKRYHFWFDKNKNKYTTLKKIEWEVIESILYPVKNKRGKIMYWKYKNSDGYIIPFWYSKAHEKYVRLKIEWEIICDTGKRKRENEKKKLISWTFLNKKWYWLPFWLDWDKYVTLKIEWEEIHNVRNRKSDEKWVLISWEFKNWKWVWQKFKLQWWKYIIKKWIIKNLTSIFFK